MQPSRSPYTLALPYLPLREPVEFAGWWLGPLDDYDLGWRDADFERAVRAFLAGFRTADREPIRNPALLVRRASGANGDPPTIDEIRALTLAIEFATIDQNPYWTPDGQHHGWAVATADNADLWVQPLDTVTGAVALGRGLRAQVLGGGYCIFDDNFIVPPPLELHMPTGVRLDAELLHAVYTMQLKAEPGSREVALCTAMRWVVKSWMNSTSVTWEDRVVLLKTASEAQTGESHSHLAGPLFVLLFANAALQEGGGVGTDELLWQPTEPAFARTWSAGTSTVSAFEHWYSALGDIRNDIIHRGAAMSLEYVQPGSPYEGSFVEIGDRVMREAIKVELGELGYPAVWRRCGSVARAGFFARRVLAERETPSE